MAILSGEWGCHTAQIVDLSIGDDGGVRVHRITCAMDCGTVVNPDQARAQIEGGIVYGLGAAMSQAITIRGGKVEQSSFRDFPVVTMADMPEIDVIFVRSDAPPGGLGEPPVPPVAPALCNALFAATGRRIRTLPAIRSGFTSDRTR